MNKLNLLGGLFLTASGVYGLFAGKIQAPSHASSRMLSMFDNPTEYWITIALFLVGGFVLIVAYLKNR